MRVGAFFCFDDLVNCYFCEFVRFPPEAMFLPFVYANEGRCAACYMGKLFAGMCKVISINATSLCEFYCVLLLGQLLLREFVVSAFQNTVLVIPE